MFRHNCESVFRLFVCLFVFLVLSSTLREKKAIPCREVHKKCPLNGNDIYILFLYIDLELCEIDVCVYCTGAITVGSLSFRPCKQALHCDYIKAKRKEKTTTKTPQSLCMYN